MPVSPMLGGRANGAHVQSHPGPHGEIKPSLVYLGVPHLKTTKLLLQEETEPQVSKHLAELQGSKQNSVNQ